MLPGLEVLIRDHLKSLKGARVGLCCNHTAVDRKLRHAIDLLGEHKVSLVRLFGPEHGVRATAQDMEGVGETVDPVSGIETVSLYGDSADSLHPPKEALEDLDVLLFDIQDIGRSEEHTSELQSRRNLVCRLLLEKKKLHNNRPQL